MSSVGNTIFTGTSRFTNDFQQVINRSVAIASLPISQLTNQKAAITDQATEVGALNSKFGALQSALQNLNDSTGLSSLNTTVSDGSIARVTLASGAVPASFSLEVTTLGGYTSALSSGSTTPITNPATQAISPALTFSLSINGVVTQIRPAANTLNSLVSTLNNTPGLNVQASIVNVGPNGQPDYRLSVQSTKLGPNTIQLNDGITDLLVTLSTGSLANYKINGLATPIQSDSRTVTLAPGVTAELLGQSAPGASSNVKISRQSTAVSNALSALVASFNAAADELDKNRGKGGGSLVGNSLVVELGNKLRSLANYSSGGGLFSSLPNLGVTFDGKGHLSFDPTVFSAAAANNPPSVTAFLGTATGTGFLQSAVSVLNSIQDATSGSLSQAELALQSRITAQNALIESSQARVDQLKTDLQARLAKADAQVAALEQSYNVLTALFQAQQYNNQNK